MGVEQPLNLCGLWGLSSLSICVGVVGVEQLLNLYGLGAEQLCGL